MEAFTSDAACSALDRISSMIRRFCFEVGSPTPEKGKEIRLEFGREVKLQFSILLTVTVFFLFFLLVGNRFLEQASNALFDRFRYRGAENLKKK